MKITNHVDHNFAIRRINIMHNSLIDISEARLTMLDEPYFAAWQRELGVSIAEHRGRYWAEVAIGCFQPVHPLARLRWDQIDRPSWRCVTFRACFDHEDIGRANGFMPAFLLPDPHNYDIGRLSMQRQVLIKRCLRRLDIVALREPDILIDQGYQIVKEAHYRNRAMPLPKQRAFRQNIESYFTPPRGLILAALRGSTLLGFTINHAVDKVAYADTGWVSGEGNKLDTWLGLSYSFLIVAQQCSGLDEIMNGLHLRERAGVSDFKRRLGFRVTPVPAYVWFAPGCNQLLRALRPHKHYRWTGMK